MKLPLVSPRYDAQTEEARNRELEKADTENFKKFQDIELQPGRNGRPGTRLILRSPDGARWAIEVSNGGVLSATSL